MAILEVPDAHPRTACWVPIYIRPIPFSEDKLTIGVVLVDDQGAFRVARAEAFATLGRILPKAAHSLISEATLSTFAHIKQALEKLPASERQSKFHDTVVSPCSIVEVGSVREASGVNADQMAESWLRTTSILAHPKKKQAGGSKIISSIKRLVTRTDPNLGPLFGQKVPLMENGREFRFGFVGPHLVANFARIEPHNIEAMTSTVAARLWNLSVHREFFADAQQSREMLVVMPPTANGAAAELEKAAKYLESSADSRTIRFRAFPSEAGVAECVVNAEGAGALTGS